MPPVEQLVVRYGQLKKPEPVQAQNELVEALFVRRPESTPLDEFVEDIRQGSCGIYADENVIVCRVELLTLERDRIAQDIGCGPAEQVPGNLDVFAQADTYGAQLWCQGGHGLLGWRGVYSHSFIRT